ncbi:MAG: SRPBCC family protein [Pseudomonadota bacterium]
MTSKWLIAVILLLVILAALAFFSRKSVRAELAIAANPTEVGSTITDPDSYPSWNPILIEVNGRFIEGETLAVVMKNDDGSTTNVQAKARKVVPNSTLNQVGGIPGVLTFDHTWRLEETDEGTRVTQFEQYRGIGVLFWDPSSVQRAYAEGNQRL